MKIIIALFFYSFTQAFAAELCDFQNTYDLHEAAKSTEVKIHHETKDQNYWHWEKEMIHAALKKESWRNIKTRDQAVYAFGDYYGDSMEPGTNAGKIVYYVMGEKTYALVHHFPGDNEYGAIFEMLSSRRFKMVAAIYDGDIACQ